MISGDNVCSADFWYNVLISILLFWGLVLHSTWMALVDMSVQLHRIC